MKHKKLFIFFVTAICLAFIYLFFVSGKSIPDVVGQNKDTNNSALVTVPDNINLNTPENKIAGVDASQPTWTFERYQALMTESGRNPGIDANIFAQIQKRKKTAYQIVSDYLTERLGSASPDVLRAFNEVPREYFTYQYQNDKSFANNAYEDKREKVKPWAIGWGSALSDYLGQTYMTQLIKPKSTDVALEIGTGSGYQSALLSRIVKKMYSIEIIKPLGEAVSKIYKPLGYDNIETRVGDGFYGWPEVKGGFDIIIVTAAAQYVPPALIQQLKPNGTMLIPVGQPFKRGQVLYVYTKDADGRVHSRKDVGVYFIPFTGAIQKTN
jgi:protein-L-isoaspartate(D-aspartate) O-methyltransferase